MTWKEIWSHHDDPDVTLKQDVFDWYQRLIAIHRSLAALQLGFAHTVLADDGDGVFAFSRDLNRDHVLVAVNRSGSERTVEMKFGPGKGDVGLIDWLNPAETKLSDVDPQKADGRPTISVVEGSRFAAVARHGVVTVTMKPYGAVILSSKDVAVN